MGEHGAGGYVADGHSPLGASTAARWLACPGSFSLCQLVPGEDESNDASLGTAAHKLAERCLVDGCDAWEFVGQQFESFDVVPDCDDALDPIAIQVYIDYVRAKAETADWSAVEYTLGRRYKPNPYFWGTADFVALQDGLLRVVDFKYGQGIIVEALGSPQLQYYAWGAINELELTDPAAIVQLVVVQPRVPGRDPISKWVTTVGDIKRWAEEVLLPGMERAISKSTELVSGEHCRFCPAKLACPKARSDLEDVVTAIVDTSDETLDQLYVKVQVAKMQIKAIEARILARLQEGARFENVKLVKRRTNRVWKPDAEEKLVQVLGDEAYFRRLLSPAEAEKISGKLKAFVAENAFLPESDGYSLRPATDSTPEASPLVDMSRQFAHY